MDKQASPLVLVSRTFFFFLSFFLGLRHHLVSGRVKLSLSLSSGLRFFQFISLSPHRSLGFGY